MSSSKRKLLCHNRADNLIACDKQMRYFLTKSDRLTVEEIEAFWIGKVGATHFQALFVFVIFYILKKSDTLLQYTICKNRKVVERNDNFPNHIG